MSIGIVGQGFVGNAIYQKFKNFYDIATYDLDESKSNSTEETTMTRDIVFVCLPCNLFLHTAKHSITLWTIVPSCAFLPDVDL